jgi:hypothetical protein
MMLINLKYWLSKKEKYLCEVLQTHPKVFNKVITTKNPNLMDFWIDEGKGFLEISYARTKWQCEGKVWIDPARKFFK